MLRMSLIFDFGFFMSYIASLLYTISIKHCFVHFKPLNGLIYKTTNGLIYKTTNLKNKDKFYKIINAT